LIKQVDPPLAQCRMWCVMVAGLVQPDAFRCSDAIGGLVLVMRELFGRGVQHELVTLPLAP
jgi:hypothetical protein